MTASFFSRTAHLAIGAALATALLLAAVSVAPNAVNRWF